MYEIVYKNGHVFKTRITDLQFLKKHIFDRNLNIKEIRRNNRDRTVLWARD